MRIIPKSAAFFLCCTLGAAPIVGTQAEEPRGVPVETARAIFGPDVAVGNQFEVYPVAVNNVAGLDSLLAISNLSTTNGAFTICTLPTGFTSFICRGEGFGPLETRFFDMPSLGLNNDSGQLQVLSQGQSLGASTLFFFNTSGGIASVAPLDFVAQ